MNLSRLIRRVISDWKAHRARKALVRLHPKLRELDEAEARAKRQHRAVEPIRAARRATMNDLLKGAK